MHGRLELPTSSDFTCKKKNSLHKDIETLVSVSFFYVLFIQSVMGCNRIKAEFVCRFVAKALFLQGEVIKNQITRTSYRH